MMSGFSNVHSGLYAIVRHPMYTGFVLFFAGIALWLESYAAFLAIGFILVLLIVRILVEETMLRKTLSDYEEYMKRVRYRVVPFVW